MNVICIKENLKESLDNALKIIKSNSTLPILNNFLLTTDSGRLKISSTDLEIGITSWVSSKISKDGGIAVSAQLLSQFVNNLPNKNINLEVKNQKLYLSCDNINAIINGLSSNDFPIIPKINNAPVLIINSNVLKESLNSVINSAALSNARPEISSIYLKMEPDWVKFISTDSFRLAHKTLFLSSKDLKDKIKINYQKSQNIIIPLRTASEVLRILNDKNIDVKIIINENQVLFDMGDIYLISRLINGDYPDYEAIIPKTSETICYLLRNNLEEAVKLSSCFSSKLNEVALKTNSSKSYLEIFSTNNESGDYGAKINSETNGNDVSVIFNWRYLLDGLKNMNSDEIVLGFNGDQKPAIIKSAKNTDFFYILMPIRNT